MWCCQVHEGTWCAGDHPAGIDTNGVPTPYRQGGSVPSWERFGPGSESDEISKNRSLMGTRSHFTISTVLGLHVGLDSQYVQYVPGG